MILRSKVISMFSTIESLLPVQNYKYLFLKGILIFSFYDPFLCIYLSVYSGFSVHSVSLFVIVKHSIKENQTKHRQTVQNEKLTTFGVCVFSYD